MENIKVIKRDGRIEKFNPEKILTALNSCSTYEKNHTIQSIVIDKIKDKTNKGKKNISVEEIQNLVVDVLSDYNKDMADKYQEYRKKRARARDINDNGLYYNTILEIINGEENEITRENSNKDSKVLNTQRDLVAGTTCRKMYRDYVMSKEVGKLHDKGVIHVHDTDYRLMKGMTNCGIFNLKDMLEKGTVMNEILIETPKSLRTAANVATQIINAIGNTQYGGITMSLAHLAPYVRISYNKHLEDVTQSLLGLNLSEEVFSKKIVEVATRRTHKEIEDSMQIIQYQLNSMTANSGQSPFITIWMDVNEEEEYKEETALLIEYLLKERIKGMKSEAGYTVSPAFPKIIYILDENNVHEGSEYYHLTELAAKCSSFRLTPDYVSAKVMRSIKEGGLTPAMGCRSMVFPYYDEEGNYKTWGRFNIGVISLNLPYIALESKDLDDFYVKLEKYLDLVRDEQLKIAKSISESSSSIAPMLWNYGAYARLPKGAKIGDLVYNGYATASIGYAGVAEVVHRFGVKYLSKEGHKMGLDIVKFMDEYCKKAREETKLGLSLYGTPLESTTQKFAQSLKDFPQIEGVNDRSYITNSYHIPVYEEVDGFSKLNFEAEFQEHSSGGCISYIEVPDISKNIPAVLNILKYIYDNIMYAEINTKSSDVCFECGFEGEIENYKPLKWRCPHCGNEDKSRMHVIRRTCGYPGSHFWNEGREEEIRERVSHF